MAENTSGALVPKKAGPTLGDMLIEESIITPDQLDRALELQRVLGGKLSDILIEQGIVSAADIAMIQSILLNIPLIDLRRHVVQPSVLRLIPEEIARKHSLIPLDVVGDSLVVVMAEPEDITTLEDLQALSKMRVDPALGIASDIKEAIDRNYKASAEIEKQIDRLAPPIRVREVQDSSIKTAAITQSPIVRTVDILIAQAVKERVSDIHIEPQEDRIRIRYRVDGVLHDAQSLPLDALEPLISRIKILAEMNITEQRRPQDGQFSTTIEGKEVDIRAATFETAYGETAVLRVLDKSQSLFNLHEVGFLPDSLKKYREMLKRPFGMILVAGPTGSGKTTTLYASLNELDRTERNIITIEDPIEYVFPDIKQSQINPKAGINFAGGLRAIMRLDPDIILVGEIRDGDTARTAIQAALTGHLVLSSIHANNATSVLFRLLDLGIERYLVSSAIIGVAAQRMVRKICPHCRESAIASTEEQQAYKEEMGQEPMQSFHGIGCNLCAGTGYLRRTGIFEVFNFSEETRRLFIQGNSDSDIATQAVSEGMINMRHDGMLKVKEGITTLQEVERNAFSIF